MRDCTEAGELQEVSSEANLRLNVWLRTVSPPKRLAVRNGRTDHSVWGRQSSGPVHIREHNNMRRSGDQGQGKYFTGEDGSSGERWRKNCQSTDQRKMEGRLGPNQKCMRNDKDSNCHKEKIICGEKKCGGTIIRNGEKQNELIKGNDSRGMHESGIPNIPYDLTRSIGREILLDPSPSNGLNQVGPPSESVPTEPMTLERMSESDDSRPAIFKPNRPTTKNLKQTKWKRIARAKGSLEDASELGERKIRSQYGEGKSEEGNNAPRKQYGGRGIDDEAGDWKKKRADPLPDVDHAKEKANSLYLSFIATETSSDVKVTATERSSNGGNQVMVLSNVQIGKEQVSAKIITVDMVSLETEVASNVELSANQSLLASRLQ
ncbi:hypothetical protein Dsin_016539 [Dipteronia sinensis]|uniref:Uncharacterized protein n=1 Tax=Dipteronia sinensis TaxID=43782 RepID=A0AAE0AE27_9ROSI|nr:hypothetical protein Dsin_016539 [Dipteronia sinensis]